MVSLMEIISGPTDLWTSTVSVVRINSDRFCTVLSQCLNITVLLQFIYSLNYSILYHIYMCILMLYIQCVVCVCVCICVTEFSSQTTCHICSRKWVWMHGSAQYGALVSVCVCMCVRECACVHPIVCGQNVCLLTVWDKRHEPSTC